MEDIVIALDNIYTILLYIEIILSVYVTFRILKDIFRYDRR